MPKLKWTDPKAFFMSGTVKQDITDEEFEMLRAKLLVAQDFTKKLKIPVIPKNEESQIVELELLLEKSDNRTELEKQFKFAFDHLDHTNC